MESDGESATPSSASGTAGLATTDTSETPRTKICVYCGSSSGKNPVYMEAARELARVMHENDIGLVYGGGTVGLMGELAKTLVSLSGPQSVHGIIPEALVRYERDPKYTSTTTASTSGGTDGTDDSSSSHIINEEGLAVPAEELYGKTTVVRDMHTRKRMMAQEVIRGGPGSGFLALSGGYGTFEELLETCTWNQLGIHDRGVCVLNVNGFYNGLFSLIGKSVEDGFIAPGAANIIVQGKTAEDAVQALREYKVEPAVLKLAWGKE
ncbi:lysine decarboxylase-like protein [Grosmannia clavigera kw1407]|uniref:Lysine decarboxylase-like protein n=1 Tax=Grosmannia clavigera (strain kw1407 / UAMH 11150) TaxID=655863 RepID=F0XD07_GROCL|nr:lysine decarboxylase-like protein [Grosmannia clavigera kw1407]EFX04184.1 lysine decarboxylase-like protein [Grosmannia clavigera kw1407]